MCQTCRYQEYLETIDGMMVEREYEFADKTLSGIKEWVLKNEHITAKQKIAIDNILESIDI